jgi:hydroxymethylbilane synthase
VVTARRVRIASRGSQLALWQAETIRSQLLQFDPGLEVGIEIIRTTGDKILDVPLARIGDRGLFTKELDEAILDGRADLAVHSLKDVPTSLPIGLHLAAVGEREDPRDVLIGPVGRRTTLRSLTPGSRIGTSSLRRRSQLRGVRPDLEVVDLRGNLNTRLEKLDRGEYEAILLASAGVRRLGWTERISEYLPLDAWLPAVGQGALGVVSRTEDDELARLLAPIHHPPTSTCVQAERTFLRELEGGCQIPIGGLAVHEAGVLTLDGLVSDIEGTVVLRATERGTVEEAPEVGRRLAAQLLARGAGAILREIRGQPAPPGIPAP